MAIDFLEILASLAWPLAFFAVGWRFATVLDYIAKRPDRERESAASFDTEIPPDLVAIAYNETEEWAQEEVLRAIREKYEALNDWNRVRIAFGVAQMD